jgi:hypothetical protein
MTRLDRASSGTSDIFNWKNKCERSDRCAVAGEFEGSRPGKTMQGRSQVAAASAGRWESALGEEGKERRTSESPRTSWMRLASGGTGSWVADADDRRATDFKARTELIEIAERTSRFPSRVRCYRLRHPTSELNPRRSAWLHAVACPHNLRKSQKNTETALSSLGDHGHLLAPWKWAQPRLQARVTPSRPEISPIMAHTLNPQIPKHY